MIGAVSGKRFMIALAGMVVGHLNEMMTEVSAE